MKYNITINQKTVIDNGLMSKLDIIDLAIFDFVYHFFNSDFEDKVTFTKNGVEYTEIRPSLLEREMPLLKIGTKRTFINRMNNLINVGLIERYENNSKENRSGYKKGVNFSIFEFDKPAKRNSQGYENDFTPPMKTDSHNNNINDNSISNNNKEEIDKSISKKDDYLPFAAEPQQEYGKVVEKKEWREDFNAYLNLVNQAKRDLLSDSEYKEYIEKYYPNADYENSVGKLVDGFWGKQEGWDYCKMKRKGKTINMLSTLKKNLDSRSRIVYKSLKPMRQNQVFNNTKSDVKVKLNPNVHLVDNDGKLSDGTFLKSDGLRYYFSYIDKKTYSIPLDAEPMPQSEKVAYDYKNGWYECE